MANKKNDIASKIVSSILRENKTIVIQDEQIGKWKEGESACSKIQHSVLERVKSKLLQSDRVIVLDKWFPTTKWCSRCGNKHDMKLDERTFICPVCGEREDRDIHAANNMICFYQQYDTFACLSAQNKDRLGTSHTSKPVKKILFSEYAKAMC